MRPQIKSTELVINFHMTETCNYSCNYCYATWESGCSSKELHQIEGAVERLIDKLADYFLTDNPLQAVMGYHGVRLNFAGGEPMLLGKRFDDAFLYARKKGFRTSIITNGAFLDADRLARLACSIDVLGVSFDTASDVIASSIGRHDRKGRRVSASELVVVSEIYKEQNPSGILKVNTVVNQHNHHECLNDVIEQVNPDKWKILRVLPVYPGITPISDEQFNSFVARHEIYSHIAVVEDNSDMSSSYLMINPNGCFYQNGEAASGYQSSDPILVVDTDEALEQISFDPSVFASRYVA